MNSATAEESAASGEELSGQASTVKALIEQFKLKNAKINYSSQMMNSGDNNIPVLGININVRKRRGKICLNYLMEKMKISLLGSLLVM
ncbi:MAG: hypothetical protein RR602_09335 [Longicatena sp.]